MTFGARAARSPARAARRARPSSTTPSPARLVALYRPFVHFALPRPALTLVTARAGGRFVLPLAPAPRRRVPSPRRRGRSAVHADDRARRLARAGRRPARGARTGRSPPTRSRGRVGAPTRPRIRRRCRYRDDRSACAACSMAARRPSGWYGCAGRGAGLIGPRDAATTAELIEALDRSAAARLERRAGPAPVRARLDMMSTGVRTPLGVRIVAADPARLDGARRGGAGGGRRLPGTRSAVVESLGGETRLEFVPDAQALARHGSTPARCGDGGASVLTGGQIGELDRADGGCGCALFPSRACAASPTERRATSPCGRRPRGRAAAPPVAARAGRPAPAVTDPRPSASSAASSPPTSTSTSRPATDLRGYVAARAGRPSTPRCRRGPGARARRADRVGRAIPAARGRPAPAGRRSSRRAAVDAGAAVPPVPQPDRGADRAGVGAVRAGREHLGACSSLGYQLSAPVWVGLLSVVGLAMQTGVVMVVYIDDAFHRRLRREGSPAATTSSPPTPRERCSGCGRS